MKSEDTNLEACPACGKQAGELIEDKAARFPFRVQCHACGWSTDAVEPAKIARKLWNEAKRESGIAGAEKKLRQAEFLLGHLEYTASEGMANEIARGHPNPEHLEFFFSACLTAAQSAFYILDKAYPAFEQLQKQWRKSLGQDGAAWFNRMVRFRDYDVHYGVTDAVPLPKYVEDHHNDVEDHHNSLFFGGEVFIGEEVNPDGKKVRGSSFRGSVSLYVDHHGGRLEATTVCRDFIKHLQSLLDAVKAAGIK